MTAWDSGRQDSPAGGQVHLDGQVHLGGQVAVGGQVTYLVVWDRSAYILKEGVLV